MRLMKTTVRQASLLGVSKTGYWQETARIAGTVGIVLVKSQWVILTIRVDDGHDSLVRNL
jgi:hypothetical protein